jgi:regulator of sigma E protease
MVALSVLILVHELGHFILAKKHGVRIERFALGFGPKLFSIKRKYTEYSICLIPLGGYVKMAGDEPQEKHSGAEWEYLSKGVFQRISIVFAGPFLNYILAFFIFALVFIIGNPLITSRVGDVLGEFPAKTAGLLKNDKIIIADGKTVKYWEELTEIIHHKTTGPLSLTVERQGRRLDFVIIPQVKEIKNIFGQKQKIGLIGIRPTEETVVVKENIARAIYLSGQKLFYITVITYKALWLMATGAMSFKDSVTGPVGIFYITSEAAKTGFIYLLQIVAVLSASLAIFNLLPIPVLDGGHILFLIIEKLRKKPLSPKTQEQITRFGIAALITLTVFAFYSDFSRFGWIDKVSKFFIHR